MIRKAIEADIHALCAIDTAARADPARHDFIERRVREGCCHLLVDDDTGEIAAYAVLTYNFYDQGMIDMLMVAPNRRREGIGTRLIEHLESECRTDRLFTSTNESNLPMQALFAKLNYSPSGIIHNLDPGDPELVYFKQIR